MLFNSFSFLNKKIFTFISYSFSIFFSIALYIFYFKICYSRSRILSRVSLLTAEWGLFGACLLYFSFFYYCYNFQRSRTSLRFSYSSLRNICSCCLFFCCSSYACLCCSFFNSAFCLFHNSTFYFIYFCSCSALSNSCSFLALTSR